MLLLLIGRMYRIGSDTCQRRLLWIDFKSLGLLRLTAAIGVVCCLSIVAAVRRRIRFRHVLIVLATLLVGTQMWRWLGNQVLRHRWVLGHARLQPLEFYLVSRDYQRAPIGMRSLSILPTCQSGNPVADDNVTLFLELLLLMLLVHEFSLELPQQFLLSLQL